MWGIWGSGGERKTDSLFSRRGQEGVVFSDPTITICHRLLNTLFENFLILAKPPIRTQVL